jgi:large subunit ribosomal protein L5
MSKKQQTDAQIEEAKAAGKAAKAEKAAKKEAAEGKGSGPAVASHTKPSVIRLRDKYRADVIPALQKEFGYTNIMAVPKVTKVVVNMGLGEATSNAKVIDTGADELGKITGQKAAVRKGNRSRNSRSARASRLARW